jgi:hypothetical protein
LKINLKNGKLKKIILKEKKNPDLEELFSKNYEEGGLAGKIYFLILS